MDSDDAALPGQEGEGEDEGEEGDGDDGDAASAPAQGLAPKQWRGGQKQAKMAGQVRTHAAVRVCSLPVARCVLDLLLMRYHSRTGLASSGLPGAHS
jgi:hypothetical protein